MSVRVHEFTFLRCKFHKSVANNEQANTAQPMDPVIRQDINNVLSLTHKAAAVLTRVILRMSLLRPVPIKREPVLGSSAGTAV